jgi:hypothetical protein
MCPRAFAASLWGTLLIVCRYVRRHGVTMCRDLTYKIDAVKPNRAETDRFRAKESPWQRIDIAYE